MPSPSPIIDALCQLLQTGDEADRCYAARALGVAEDTRAVDPLTERLRDEDIDVCIDAAEALGHIGAPEAIPALVESLEHESSGEICTAIAGALGRIGGSEAAAALQRVALERPPEMEWSDDWDTWWDVQREAVNALGRFGDESAVSPLVTILEDEAQQDIESEIVNALARIPKGGVEFLIERLKNQELLAQHRRRAARALATVAGGNEAVERSLGRALQDPAPDVRAEAVAALGKQGATRYLHALILLLRDPDPEVRSASLKAVVRLTGESAPGNGLQQELLSLIDDPDSQVRATLLSTLTATVAASPLSDEMLEKVRGNLNDPHAETATAAGILLGHNGNPEVVADLLPILSNRSGHPMVRREAALSIGRLGRVDGEVLDTLSQTVTDSEQAVRLATLSALMMLAESDQAGTLETDDGDGKRTPLEIVIAATNGQIEISEVAAAESVAEAPPVTDAEEAIQLTRRTGRDLLQQTPPETATPESGAAATEGEVTLPDTPTTIVQKGQVKDATSTLEAIALDNVETMLQQESAPETPEHDAETLEYLEVVEENRELMRRIRSNRRIDTRQDVRRLGARILAGSDRPEAVEALIQVLNDDDELLRREAAEAVGSIASRSRDHAGLMDALGTLITQLAVGDQDLRIACAGALGHLGNQAAIVPLTEAMKDSKANVRVRAIEALGRLTIEGADPTEAGHMVVHRVPPLSVAGKMLERFDDPEAGVRIALTKELGRILDNLDEAGFHQRVVEQIIDSVFQWSGEEARLIGRELRAFDTEVVTEKLLSRLELAEDSTRRSVVIEMLEELINPHHGQPEKAA
jgi:HEAT repeat protein